jgi:flagellar basal-body rod modification protein FlgD
MTTAASSVAGAAASSSGATGTQKTLGKDDFLKLLLTQLQNQDPLQPVDNQAMIAQLAQFSSLEQMQGVADRLDTLLLAQTSANQMSTTSLVGREVTYRTDAVDWTPGSAPVGLQARLAANAGLTAVIRDASGHAVRTLSLGAQEAGSVEISWDGKDDAGNPLPAGRYSVDLVAKDGAGNDVGAELRVHGRVRGVSFDGGTPLLLIGGSQVKMSDVVEVIQA